MTNENHLALQKLTLLPGAEWPARLEGTWLAARLAEGSGYWLRPGAVRQLNCGDVVMALNKSACVLRASSLSSLHLQFFLVSPRLLDGLLAPADIHRLQTVATTAPALVFFWRAQDSVACQFAALVESQPQNDLATRCRLLQLWADAVSGLLPISGAEPVQKDLIERFRRLIEQMSDAQFALCSLTELASQLHCSQRHLSRLFRRTFGISFRTRQTEVRLQHASRILTTSDTKIIEVAYESGYRHLGLFNTMFKKHFGTTPSLWRQQARKPGKSRPDRTSAAARVALGALLLLCPLAVWGQTNRPPTATARPVFEVRKYDVRGNSLLPQRTLDTILAPATGTNVDLSQIRKALANLQAEYRVRGYATVAVSLPQQKLTNSTVFVQVTQAPVTAINVVNNRYFSSNNIMRALPSLRWMRQPPGDLLNTHVMQSELDQANANRDRQIYPVLGPGSEPGTSELTLKVKDRLPLHGRFELNNQYTPGTPTLRGNATLLYNNLWGYDHQAGLQYTFTPQQLRNSDTYETTPIDRPQVANYSAYYRMPLGEVTSVREQIDSNPLNFGYNEATHKFNLPPATGRPELNVYASRSISDTGVQYGNKSTVFETNTVSVISQDSGDNVTLNEALGGSLSTPLPQLGPVSSIFSFGLDLKRFEMSSFNTNNFYYTIHTTNSSGPVDVNKTISSGQPTAYQKLTYLPLNAGLSESIPDPWAVSFLTATVAFNPFQSAYRGTNSAPMLSSDHEFAGASYSTNATAGYVTLNMNYTREQPIYNGWTLLTRASGQWANEPLISNEQFAMGGLSGVRGYLDGQAYGDTGWKVQLEPRTPTVNLGMVDGTLPLWLRGSVFVDYGELYMLDDKSAGSSANRQFLGTGAGLSATIGDHLDARVTLALPLLSAAGRSSGEAHIYFSLGMQF